MFAENIITVSRPPARPPNGTSEYGVSYGYGTAMAASSYLILSSRLSIANAAGLPLLPAIKDVLSFTSFHPVGIVSSLSTTMSNLQTLLPASLPAFHAFTLFLYGTRLDMFFALPGGVLGSVPCHARPD
jgi:hypothetical protein